MMKLSKELIQRINPKDLVITSDIPLAAQVIEKGALVLNPLGELYNSDSIQGRLSTRNFMDALRSSGIDTGGPPALSKKDRNEFANQLDKILSSYKNIRI